MNDLVYYPRTVSLYRSDYASKNEYYKAYRDYNNHYSCKVQVDDGYGGRGWKFFESHEDYRIWKNQK